MKNLHNIVEYLCGVEEELLLCHYSSLPPAVLELVQTSYIHCKVLVVSNGVETHLLKMTPFLGGLSLHLNHLIAERMSAPYWQFGTLPIGIFLSNLDSGQLETSLMTSYCHF